MNKIIIPVLASVLILGVLGTAEDAFAPKKLFVGGLSWDAETQSFEVEGTVQCGIAKAAENADFSLKVIFSFIDLTNIHQSYTIVIDNAIGSPPLGCAEVIEINQDVQWDRLLDNGELFQGRTDFTVELQILNPAGKPVAFSEPFTANLNITPPPPEPTCEEICEERAAEISRRCLTEGGSEEECAAAAREALEVCVRECRVP